MCARTPTGRFMSEKFKQQTAAIYACCTTLWLCYSFMLRQNCADVMCMQGDYAILKWEAAGIKDRSEKRSATADRGCKALETHPILHSIICHMPYSKICPNTAMCSFDGAKDAAQLWKDHLATLCTCRGKCVHPTHWCLYEHALVGTCNSLFL